MPIASLLQLLALAALWGASFLLMRIAVPTLGPVLLIFGRVTSATLFLLAFALLAGKLLELRAHWRHYLLLGLLNSALPFLLIAYAAQTLPASVLSVLNATAPISGALIAAVASRRVLPAPTLLGLALGIGGVALLVGFDPSAMQQGAALAIAAGVGAAFIYGLASVYVRTAPKVSTLANAHGCMAASVLLVAPALPLFPAHAAPSIGVIAAVLALGVLCSGVAYLMYFRLITDIGPASALTVTFLVPVFGVLWGWLFLDEAVGWHTLAGAMAVLAGTALVTRDRPPPATNGSAAAGK